MAHARKTEDCLEALSRLREDPTAPVSRAEIGQYLAHKSNAVVAKAAQMVADSNCRICGLTLWKRSTGS
jgi:hypothetical protein